MKTTLSVVTMLALTIVVGCQSSGSQGGGVSRDEGFKIAVPQFETVVKQGELQTVTVSVKRDDYFKQDVTLEINTSPGVTVEPTRVSVKAKDKPDVQVRISANKDSALGEYRVYVNGKPETGEPTSADFKVKVVAQ